MRERERERERCLCIHQSMHLYSLYHVHFILCTTYTLYFVPRTHVYSSFSSNLSQPHPQTPAPPPALPTGTRSYVTLEVSNQSDDTEDVTGSVTIGLEWEEVAFERLWMCTQIKSAKLASALERRFFLDYMYMYILYAYILCVLVF